MNGQRRWLALALLAGVALVAGCGDNQTGGSSRAAAAASRPNILMIVWDTVRADHLSLDGYPRPTTPLLDDFARRARVFENCVAVSSTTVPSHASMFTGLMPTQHGASNEQPLLADQFVTLAELLQAQGYRTYLFSENPHLCKRNHFTQGFDVAEHPWSPQYEEEALRITLRKRFPGVDSTQVPEELETRKLDPWRIKAAGELAQQGVQNWLNQQAAGGPFLIFVNYMEAHRPLIPPLKYRKMFMTPKEIAAASELDQRWEGLWSYVFGLRDLAPGDIELIAATYDAALRELDDLTHNLLESLRAGGYLDNTVVVVVGDHGEHLGEHHLLDHQFSVYEPLMRVPLVLYYPPRVLPGRDGRPVMNVDLFPTLLELAGIEPRVRSKAVSLLNPLQERPRLGEDPAVAKGPLLSVGAERPDFDPRPWARTLRAYYHEPYKFIKASNGRNELYDLTADPHELQNLIHEKPQVALRMATELRAYVASLKKGMTTPPRAAPGPSDAGYLERLRALGYVGASQPSEDESDSGGDRRSSEDGNAP